MNNKLKPYLSGLFLSALVMFASSMTVAQSLQEKAEAAVANRDYRSAKSLYYRLIRQQPDTADFYAQVAKLEKRTGKKDAAYQLALQALQRDANNYDAILVLAEILSGRDDYAAALSHYQQLASNYPDDYRAHIGLSIAYSQLGDEDNAMKFRQKAENLEQ